MKKIKPRWDTIERVSKVIKRAGKITLTGLYKKLKTLNYDCLKACLDILENKQNKIYTFKWKRKDWEGKKVKIKGKTIYLPVRKNPHIYRNTFIIWKK